MPNKKIVALLAFALSACATAPQQPSAPPEAPPPASAEPAPAPAADPAPEAAVAPEVAPAPTATASVGGKLSYRTRQALPPDALIRVQLLEVGASGEPKLIAEQVLEPKGKQVPLAFKVSYDPKAIVAKNRYRLGARVEAGGVALMVSEGSNGVITLGYPKSRNLVLKPVKKAK